MRQNLRRKCQVCLQIPVPEPTAAQRITARWNSFHLTRFGARSDVEAWLERFVEEKQYTAESLKMVDSTVIWNFLCSETGHRMAAAQAEGRLHKEQQFVMGDSGEGGWSGGQ